MYTDGVLVNFNFVLEKFVYSCNVLDTDFKTTYKQYTPLLSALVSYAKCEFDLKKI